MVDHLNRKASELAQITNIGRNDIVIDIGSNDGTFLSNFVESGAKLIGIDPTAEKFRQFYHPSIQVIVDFFTSHEIWESK
jgi:NDP-4-keto-2,6-dideoxyhexose 3-C-methyltransferase